MVSSKYLLNTFRSPGKVCTTSLTTVLLTVSSKECGPKSMHYQMILTAHSEIYNQFMCLRLNRNLWRNGV